MEEVKKIALSSNDDKRIQTFDKGTTFPYGANVFKVCENEMLSKNKFSDRDNDKDKDKGKTSTEDKDNATTKTEDKNKTKPKIKTENKDPLDKINNKISAINKLNEGLAKVKADVTKKVELVYEAMCELQDEIYSDDSWLRLVELDRIDA